MMVLSQDDGNSTYQIQRYEPGCVTINETPYQQSLIVTPHTLESHWPITDILQLTPDLLQPILQLAPEIVLFGSGDQMIFPSPELLQPLIQQQLGYETMNTASACRTFNVLCAEGRKVVAALIIEPKN